MPINENTFKDIPIYLPDEKFFGMLGLARNAGCLKTGTAQVKAQIRSKTGPHLVIISESASDNTRRDLWGFCHHYGVDFLTVRCGDRLSESVGKDSDIKAVCVHGSGFAKAIARLVTEATPSTDEGRGE